MEGMMPEIRNESEPAGSDSQTFKPKFDKILMSS